MGRDFKDGPHLPVTSQDSWLSLIGLAVLSFEVFLSFFQRHGKGGRVELRQRRWGRGLCRWVSQGGEETSVALGETLGTRGAGENAGALRPASRTPLGCSGSGRSSLQGPGASVPRACGSI